MVSLEVQPLRSSFGKVFMGAAGSGGPSDDQFNRVSFLSHFEGANNGVNNAFDDGSTSNHTITANGNVTQGSFNPYGTNWGIDFPDSDNNWVTVSSHADLAIGANDDYTFEYFIFFRNNAIDQVVLDGRYANNYANGTFPVLTIRGLVDYQGSAHDPVISGAVVWSPHPGTLTALTSNDLMVLGSWNHVAAVRSSGTVNLYLNGIRQTANYTSNTTVATQSPWKLGDIHHPTAVQTLQFKNILSNFRYVKGTAVYSGSSFTVPTSPLTAITNTKLLLFQSNRIVDNSATGHTLTPNGLPAVTAFGPSLSSSVYDPAVNGASLYNGVDADGNYVSAADSADWDFGSGNYTVECWAYATAQGSFNKLVGQWAYDGANAANSWVLETVGTDVEAYAKIGGSAVLIAQGAALVINQWNHVALVRNGNNHNIYINGVAGATTSNSSAYETGNGSLEVGSFSQISGASWDGYITDVRVVKGTAVYTSNFTPPTAPLTAITNTKLLLNMADGQAIDSAAQNNLTLAGNAKISTGQAKFGNTSMVFDGTGDGAYYANGAALGTGDWTIETFLWVNDFDANLGVFQYGGADGALGSMVLTNQKIRVLSSAVAARLDTSGTINAQTWYHVAYVSYGGTLKVYINGTADSTTFDASSTTWTFTDTNIYVGARYYSSAVQLPFDGYLDEFRVSHFARYTSNFTAPTKAFADKGQ
jgi:hypothetical protein